MLKIDIKNVENKFLVIIFSSGILKTVVVLSRVSRIILNKISDVSNCMTVLKNFIIRLGELEGRFFVILRRKEDVMECYLLFCLMALRLAKLRKIVRKYIAQLKNIAEILGLYFMYLDKTSIEDILRFLISKQVVLKQSRKIEIVAQRYDQPSKSGGILGNDKQIQNRLLIHTQDSKLLEGFMFSIIQNGQFIALGLDLNSIKQAFNRIYPRRHNVLSILNFKDPKKVRRSENQIEYVTIKMTLLIGQELAEMFSLLDSGYDKLEQFLYIPSSFLPYRFIEKNTRRRGLKVMKIIDEILNGSFEILIKADFDVALYFYVVLINMLVLAKRKGIWIPNFGPCEGVTKGDIHVGWQLKFGEPVAPFYLSLSDIQRHVLILGRTGMGKTRLARVIIEEILEKTHSNVWVFDIHREYADLVRRYDFDFYMPGTMEFPLMINIFESVNEDPESYSTFLTALLLEIIRLRGDEITAQMERALSYAVWSTVTADKPSPLLFFKNLIDWCKEAGSDIPTALYTFYAVTNRIKSIFSGASRYIFWVKRSNIDIGKLKKRNVIFDLSFLFKRNLKREILLLVNIILRYVVMNIFRDGINIMENPKLCIVVEEGRYLIPWRKIQSSVDTTAIEDFATLARKYGLGLIVISQSPYTISPDIISNAGTLFMMNAEIPEHEHIIIDDTNLKRYIQVMPPREAIVKLTSHSALIHVKVREIDSQNVLYMPKIKAVEPSDDEYMIEVPFEKYIKDLLAQ